MCGATDNRAAQTSLTLTLSPRGAREPERIPFLRPLWHNKNTHYGGGIMGLANGVHHLAICTKDIKKQIDYFSQVVGMELVALYWMHGVDNTFHGFMKLSDSSSI